MSAGRAQQDSRCLFSLEAFPGDARTRRAHTMSAGRRGMPPAPRRCRSPPEAATEGPPPCPSPLPGSCRVSPRTPAGSPGALPRSAGLGAPRRAALPGPLLAPHTWPATHVAAFTRGRQGRVPSAPPGDSMAAFGSLSPRLLPVSNVVSFRPPSSRTGLQLTTPATWLGAPLLPVWTHGVFLHRAALPVCDAGALSRSARQRHLSVACLSTLLTGFLVKTRGFFQRQSEPASARVGRGQEKSVSRSRPRSAEPDAGLNATDPRPRPKPRSRGSRSTNGAGQAPLTAGSLKLGGF